MFFLSGTSAVAAACCALLRERRRRNSNADAVRTTLMRTTIATAMPMIAPVDRSDFMSSTASASSTIVVVAEGDGPAVFEGDFDTVVVSSAVLFAVQS